MAWVSVSDRTRSRLIEYAIPTSFFHSRSHPYGFLGLD